MLFQWPTIDQIIYRVIRLRRLIGVSVMVPLIVLLALSWLDPQTLSAHDASIAALVISLLVTAHAVFFPNVTLETLALSLASTLLVVVMPWIKAVSMWAPQGHETGALVILMGFAVAATGVVLALFQIILGGLVYAGPMVHKRLMTSVVVPCSPGVAFQQFSLRPQTRRGRVLTGPEDENGFFDVAVAAAQPEGDALDLVRLDAKVMFSTPERHDVMLLLRNGSITVTSQSFRQVVGGCEVAISDLPGDFTAGMHLVFWLTDQQADNLTETTDLVFGKAARANGLAHNGSLLAVAGAVLSPRAPDIGRTG